MNLWFSNSHRWRHCGKSVEPVNIPAQQDTSDTDEGVAFHWLMEQVLTGDAHGPEDYLGEMAPNGIDITVEMVRHANVDYLLNFKRFDKDNFGVEKKAHIFGIRGRVDFYSTHPTTLTVVDFKYGYRPVTVEDNWQLLLAAISIWDEQSRIQMAIYSPRATPKQPWHWWIIGPDELREYRDIIHQRVVELEMGDRREIAGAHCKYCRHAVTCAGLGQRIEDLMNTTDLKELHDLQKLIKTRVAAIEADHFARLQMGQQIEGWTYDFSLGNRTLVLDDVGTLEARLAEAGVMLYEPKMKTPAQLEKEGMDVDRFCHRTVLGAKLVPWNQKKVNELFKEKDA